MAYEIDLRENDLCVIHSIAYILDEPSSEIIPPGFKIENGPLSGYSEINAMLNVKYNMCICFWADAASEMDFYFKDTDSLWIAIVPCYGKSCSINEDSHAIVMKGNKLEYDCEEQRKTKPSKIHFGITLEHGTDMFNPQDIFGWYSDSEYVGKIEYKRWLTK